jgi:threonine synthase
MVGASLDDDATLDEISDLYHRTGYLADPHTAVGIGAARACRGRDDDGERPVVCMATAHPAKFPDAVERATGVRPPLPGHLADLQERLERYEVLGNDFDAVRAYVESRVAH